MATVVKWILRILIGLVIVVIGMFLVAAVIPQEVDAAVDMNNHGAGAQNIEPAYSGLLREFPAPNTPDDNPTTREKVELGHLLFFDPVLSQDNDTACATCHQPDLGFSDGLETAVGHDGTVLTRNTPTLWNVTYVVNLFWDGRLQSLEAQAELPLTHPNEMGVSDTAALEAELRAIPEYVTLFDRAFGGGETAVSLSNIENALAAFQRTLITNNSPFDQYAGGNFNALTAQQRRGLAIFRSGATRCFECHTAPTFATDTFRVVGVPDEDPGRAAISSDGLPGAFKVPTLRNIALTAPYMHNGQFATLEEVVDFYAEGGGHPFDKENIDPFVNGFDLTAQEKEDLITFLYALTDESGLPAIPASVPSGLPIIASANNPAREMAASYNIGGSAETAESRPPTTIIVQPGETIQSAVDSAQPGDTVQVPYGTYHERVVVDINGLTLEGIPNEAGEWPILDGQELLSEGVIASGSDFVVGNFQFLNYTDNGVLVEGANNIHFHDIYAENVGTYGVYPVRSSNVLIERVEVTGVDDAGIYAGQCVDVTVRDSVAYGNVIGLELENTLGGEVYNNHLYDNTVGILLVLLPQLTSKVSANAKVYDNILENNNTENFAPEGATAGFLPPGIGILIAASDNNEVYNNTIQGNKTSGVAVFNLTGTGAFNPNEVDIGIYPEGNWIHDNEYSNNGFDPDQFVKELGIPVGDILWDGTGANNRFNESGATGFPPLLPGDGWPGFVRQGYGNILSWLLGLVA